MYVVQRQPYFIFQSPEPWIDQSVLRDLSLDEPVEKTLPAVQIAPERI